MTLLEDYRRCFEACGIEWPKEMNYPPGCRYWIKLCVCRCAAEDWLWSRMRDGGEWCAKKRAGSNPFSHESIISLCYSAAGKESA